MKINKQLFEDVLSGKLKGTFVLRNGYKFDSSFLRYDNRLNRPYLLGRNNYYDNGLSYIIGAYEFDIIDFIPDTDMKRNELTIEIPDGKVIDWDESKKQNKIILEDKELTYEYICKNYLKNDFYFIKSNGDVGYLLGEHNNASNCAKTEHQLECILAKNKLANVATYLNDGWKPSHDNTIVLLIKTKTGVLSCEVINGFCASDCGSIWFKSKDLARQAIKILGEETVKLALEPLGFH